MPWFEHAKRETGSLAIADCNECKQTMSRTARQSLACGYEPPAPGNVPVVPWEHRGRTVGVWEPKICAGYVCSMPEVIEIARAHLHWSKGSLHTFCRDTEPNDLLNEGVERFEGAIHSLNAWLMKSKDEQ